MCFFCLLGCFFVFVCFGGGGGGGGGGCVCVCVCVCSGGNIVLGTEDKYSL